ncbi:flagellar hook-associated protein FlgL [Salipaludibacillus sp. HK11]|uniref:flagellar hook-associated protein FlgL n=1 Tax=Salipaludibacillus sp. HK11 TaxID=3394320 RepID=UPI0039FC702C
MRVTQSMLASNSLRHLSQSYERLQTLNDQLSSGKKISRASQDPVVAMNGMRYRTQVTETEQFKRNLSEVYNWMDTADSTLDQTTNALHRVRELTVQASNDSYEATQRGNIAKEVAQLREHLESLANTKANNKYIFNGTNTTNAPIDADKMDIELSQLTEMDPDALENYQIIFKGGTYEYDLDASNVAGEPVFQNTEDPDQSIQINIDGGNIDSISHTDDGEITTLSQNQLVLSDKSAVSTNGQNVEIELLKGTKIPININPQSVFSNELFGDIKALEKMLEDPSTTASELSGMLDVVDKHINNSVNERAELGARMNRVEMIDTRIQNQQVIAKRIMSDNENADMELVITDLLSQENVHRAALSATGRLIQPSLMDFLR